MSWSGSTSAMTLCRPARELHHAATAMVDSQRCVGTSASSFVLVASGASASLINHTSPSFLATDKKGFDRTPNLVPLLKFFRRHRNLHLQNSVH